MYSKTIIAILRRELKRLKFGLVRIHQGRLLGFACDFGVTGAMLSMFLNQCAYERHSPPPKIFKMVDVPGGECLS